MYTAEQLNLILQEAYSKDTREEALEHISTVFVISSGLIEEYQSVLDKAKNLFGEILEETGENTLETSMVKVSYVPPSEYVSYQKSDIESAMIADPYIQEALAPLAQIKTKSGFVRITKKKNGN